MEPSNKSSDEESQQELRKRLGMPLFVLHLDYTTVSYTEMLPLMTYRRDYSVSESLMQA